MTKLCPRERFVRISTGKIRKNMGIWDQLAYVEVDDDSDDEAGLLLADKGKGKALDDKGEGTSTSAFLPKPPSKRPRLSGQPDIPEEGSPAANETNRPKFLSSLSLDSSYKSLVDALMVLPVFGSSHPSSSGPPTSKANLPIWASWHWGRKFLPSEIHAKPDEFHTALSALHRYTFVDHNKECWRVVKVEADDFNIPDFLRTSVLDVKMAEEVVAVMKEVSARRAEVDQVEIIERDHGEGPKERGQGDKGEERTSNGEKKGVEQKQGEKMSAKEAGRRDKQEERSRAEEGSGKSGKPEDKEDEGMKREASAGEKLKGKRRKHRSPSPGPSQ
ncbi:hypothetical protein V8E55_010205 [Tylopilus felleus]